MCEVLSEFGIDLKRVYCITTDNGANVVLATKLLALARNHRSLTENSEGILPIINWLYLILIIKIK